MNETVARFYQAKKANERVAALVDVATNNECKLDGGHAAAMLRRYPPPDVLRALMVAIAANAAQLDTFMERILQNGRANKAPAGASRGKQGRGRSSAADIRRSW